MVAHFKASHQRVRVEGLVDFHVDTLFLDYERIDVFGDGQIVHALMPIDAIDHISLRYDLFGATLRIRVSDMTQLSRIGWRKGQVFEMSVARRDEDEARRIAGEILEAINGVRKKGLVSHTHRKREHSQ